LAICAKLADGESLRSICDASAMPDKSTVLRWLMARGDFRDHYARARELGADAMAELALSEATAAMKPEDVQRARLAFDARKWWAGKVAPKKYGERVATEVSGPDGRPIETRELPPPMVPAEVAAAVRALIAAGEAELGMPRGRGGNAARLRAILASGEPIPPDIYAALYGGRGRDD